MNKFLSFYFGVKIVEGRKFSLDVEKAEENFVIQYTEDVFYHKVEIQRMYFTIR